MGANRIQQVDTRPQPPLEKHVPCLTDWWIVNVTNLNCSFGLDLLNANDVRLLWYDNAPSMVESLHAMLRELGIDITNPCATQCTLQMQTSFHTRYAKGKTKH